MSWLIYEIKLRLDSFLHIGYGTRFGPLIKTRLYIPGKNLWGAITSILTKKMMKEYIPQAYLAVGNLLAENCKFGYFYIVEGEKILYPNYNLRRGLCFGHYTENELKEKYLSSYISTSIDKKSFSALEGSLHEIEVLKPGTFFAGEVAIHTEISQKKLKGVRMEKLATDSFTEEDILNAFTGFHTQRIGGERTYGFGILRLQEKTLKNVVDDIKVKLGVNTDYLALSHILFDVVGSTLSITKGDFEPIIGREWNKRGPGHKITFNGLSLSPGTIFRVNKGIEIEMHAFGFNKVGTPLSI